LLYAFGTNFCIAKFIQRELPKKYWFIAVAMYICLPQFYLQTLNIARQYFAISILFWAYGDFLSNKKLAFSIKFAIALLFGHLSVIVMLPIIFISRKNIYFVLKIILLICTVLAYKYMHLWLQHIGYSVYVENTNSESSNNIQMLVISVALFSMCFLEKYFSAYREKKVFYFNLLFFTACIFLVAFIDSSSFIEIIRRMALYTLPCILIIVPNIVNKIKGNQKLFVEAMIIVFVFGYYFSHLLKNAVTDKLTPYSFGLGVQ
jgi:transmembrane protein EpsG